MKTLGDMNSGLRHVWDGFRFLRAHPVLWKWAFIPFAMGMVLFLVFFNVGLGLVSGWVAGATGWLVGLVTPLGIGFLVTLVTLLSWPLAAILWVVYLIVTLYGTFLVTTIVAAPFHSLLAERVLMLSGALEEKPFQLKAWLATSAKMMFTGVIKSLVFLFFGLIIFICSFVPILNLVSSFCALLIMSFDSMDYSFEMLEMSLSDRFRFFQRNFVLFSGAAGFLGLTLFVPGSTLLFIPLSVIGSALQLSRLKGGDS